MVRKGEEHLTVFAAVLFQFFFGIPKVTIVLIGILPAPACPAQETAADEGDPENNIHSGAVRSIQDAQITVACDKGVLISVFLIGQDQLFKMAVPKILSMCGAIESVACSILQGEIIGSDR